MDIDDWDLFSFVSSNKATTFTNQASFFETPSPSQTPTTVTTASTTNNIISPQNIPPFYFDDFSFAQDNNPIPFSPLEKNDFIDLDKLKINSNPTTTVPTLITTTTSSPITIIPTPSTTTIPGHITFGTITNTSVHGLNKNSTFFDCPTLIEQQQLQPNGHELDKFIVDKNSVNPTLTNNFNTPTLTTPPTPTRITPMITTNAFANPTTTFFTSTTIVPVSPSTTTNLTNIITSAHGTSQYPTISDYEILIKQQQIQPNNSNQVFDQAYNYSSVPEQPPRKLNQSPIQLPNTGSRILPNSDTQKEKHNSRIRKINNKVTLECHVRTNKLSEDWWSWTKYGQKNISGSPHPRSYFKCNSSKDCSAKKLIQKSDTKEDTFVVTFVGAHNHEKPTGKWNKSSKVRLPAVGNVRSSRNVSKMGSQNVTMMHVDHPESTNIQVLPRQSETEVIETHLPAAREIESSPNVENLFSYNMMMLQSDEPMSSNAQVYSSESHILPSRNKLIENTDEDEEIMIPNMTGMSDDFLLDFNHLNGSFLFP